MEMYCQNRQSRTKPIRVYNHLFEKYRKRCIEHGWDKEFTENFVRYEYRDYLAFASRYSNTLK